MAIFLAIYTSVAEASASLASRCNLRQVKFCRFAIDRTNHLSQKNFPSPHSSGQLFRFFISLMPFTRTSSSLNVLNHSATAFSASPSFPTFFFFLFLFSFSVHANSISCLDLRILFRKRLRNPESFGCLALAYCR